MRAAISYIKKLGPKAIVVAVPVAPPEVVRSLRREVDKVVCLSTPEPFFAIGQFYEEFEQVEDEEVIRLLSARRGPA
jgi:putative phosphoribosyl transferase